MPSLYPVNTTTVRLANAQPLSHELGCHLKLKSTIDQNGSTIHPPLLALTSDMTSPSSRATRCKSASTMYPLRTKGGATSNYEPTNREERRTCRHRRTDGRPSGSRPGCSCLISCSYHHESVAKETSEEPKVKCLPGSHHVEELLERDLALLHVLNQLISHLILLLVPEGLHCRLQLGRVNRACKMRSPLITSQVIRGGKAYQSHPHRRGRRPPSAPRFPHATDRVCCTGTAEQENLNGCPACFQTAPYGVEWLLFFLSIVKRQTTLPFNTAWSRGRPLCRLYTRLAIWHAIRLLISLLPCCFS